MSAFAKALLDEMGPAELAALARALAPYLPAPAAPADDAWLDVKAASQYLGMSTHALHRLTAARQIPFSQDKPGARCYFRRSDLDRWRERDGRGAV